MKKLLPLVSLLLSAPLLLGMGKYAGGPHLSWTVEGDETDGPKMVRKDVAAAPDGLVHYFRITPMVTELNVRGMVPIPAEDGTYGASFILNEEGWRSIQAVAAMDAGKLIRVYFNGRPLEFQRVTKPTKDDHMIMIWGGLTEADMAQLKGKYKVAPTPVKP